MDNKITLKYPSNLVCDIHVGEHRLITDYPVERGGYNVAISPWEVFLSSIIACQGVNLAKYCKEHQLDYSEIELELVPIVSDTRRDPNPEYQIRIDIPETFPSEHINEMVRFFSDCPVVNHLTKLNPILSTYINGELVIKNERE